MRALIQRVSHASVTVEGECVGKIEKGLLVLLASVRRTLKNRQIFWQKNVLTCASLWTKTTR